jgi:hypothetical protein
MLAVGCVGVDSSAEDSTGTVSENSSSHWQCADLSAGVSCVGHISAFAITVLVKNTRALNNNEVNVLSNDLNKLSVLDGNVLDKNQILNDVEVTVLQDFLNKFNIIVSNNDIDVCTNVLGIQSCK